jgi:hypothetical protein
MEEISYFDTETMLLLGLIGALPIGILVLSGLSS